MAEPPKTNTATTMTTIKRSGPKISPKNTVFSFDVLRARVVPSGMKGRRQLETGSFWARMV
jgi:hypothetical protein